MDQFIEWMGRVPFVRFVLSGVIIALLILALGFHKPLLRTIGKLPGLAPNWLSLWRLPLVCGGCALYLMGNDLNHNAYIGFCMLVFGFTLDRMDGKVAEAHGDEVAEFPDTIQELNHPGKTKIGGWLDPLVDKVTILPIIAYFCIQGELWLPVGILILTVEVIGTISRPPFRLLPLKLRQVNASWAGKMKFTFQFTALIVYMPVDQGWTKMNAVPNYFLVGAAVFTILSFASKIEFRGWLTWINHLFDRLVFIDRAFKHN